MAQVLKAQAAFRQSKKAFCAERGISPAVFIIDRNGCLRGRSRGKEGETAAFVEVKARRPTELEVWLPNGQWAWVRADSRWAWCWKQSGRALHSFSSKQKYFLYERLRARL